jgi:dTMP kinase
MSKGCLVSLEGLDGAGKTTQMDLLERWLQSRGIRYLRTREPGGTPLGAGIRDLLFNHPNITISPLAEAFLFQADRAQHFATLILPALAEGTLVITDRCFDSSIAYQGVARGVGTELVERLSLLAMQGRAPDLTILLDLDPTQVHARTTRVQAHDGLHEPQSRFDKESETFHLRLREAFLALARAHPERIKTLDAAQPAQQIHQEIVKLVEELLERDTD